jgi:hypothetical protein
MEPLEPPDLSYDNDDISWSRSDSVPLGCQIEMMIDPALQDDNPASLLPPKAESPGGIINSQRDVLFGEADGALPEHNSRNSCPEENEPAKDSIDSNGKTPTSSTSNIPSSLADIVESKDRLEHLNGKTSKPRNTSRIDHRLRDAITAVITKATVRNDTGSFEATRMGSENRKTEEHLSKLSALKVTNEGVLSIPELTMATHLASQTPCIGVPSTSGSDEGSLTPQEILQAISDAGYVITKGTKPTGHGRAIDHSASSAIKKRDLVTCDACSKFSGRPCELKYASKDDL